MTYASGGLIQATDFNTIVGTSPGSTSNALNTVWAVGNGNSGYGQTAVAQVSSGNTITAAQWADLITKLNAARTHQSGSGSGISNPTAGTTVTYLSTLTTAVTSSYANRALYSSSGTTTTGSTFTRNPNTAEAGGAAQTFTYTNTVTFASADQARYFFNAGGRISYIPSAATNTGGTSRGADLITMFTTYLGSVTNFGGSTNSGKSGTGGTVNTNNTSLGYFGLTTSYQTIVQITETGTYAGDYIKLEAKSNGVQGSNGDVGTVITFQLTLYAAAHIPGGVIGSNEAINVSLPYRFDVIYPETTNLSNSWGTVTVA